MTLWRKHPVTGYWQIARRCDPRESHEWLAIFRADEPGVSFALSARKPRY